MPNYGEYPGGPGPMVVQAGPGAPGSPPPTQKLITDQSLVELAALPGVVSVIPRDMAGGQLKYQRLEGYGNIIGVGGIKDLSELGLTAQQGTLELGRGAAVVGAMVAQNFYDPRWRPGQDPPTPPDLMGANLKLILSKWTQDGTEVRKSIPINVIGVIAETRNEPDYSIYMTIEEVASFNEWMMGRRISRSRDGYQQAVVKAQDISQVIDLTDQINALGYQAYTPASFVQGINSFYLILQVIFGGVGAIALLVAAIGIANTMAMAILERTREIGLMKAIGATNRDVLSVFLGEAAGIGFLGGLGGVILGWSAGQVINVVALAYLAGQAAQTGGMPPPTMAVYTPLWLPVFTLIFATIIGLISGLYPALRAATLIPVNALKYE
jgi:putative ABC transport system permease protein